MEIRRASINFAPTTYREEGKGYLGYFFSTIGVEGRHNLKLLNQAAFRQRCNSLILQILSGHRKLAPASEQDVVGIPVAVKGLGRLL